MGRQYCHIITTVLSHWHDSIVELAQQYCRIILSIKRHYCRMRILMLTLGWVSTSWMAASQQVLSANWDYLLFVMKFRLILSFSLDLWYPRSVRHCRDVIRKLCSGILDHTVVVIHIMTSNPHVAVRPFPFSTIVIVLSATFYQVMLINRLLSYSKTYPEVYWYTKIPPTAVLFVTLELSCNRYLIKMCL